MACFGSWQKQRLDECLHTEFLHCLVGCFFEPSHHLKKLTQTGLLEREQRGKWAYFSLNPEAAGQLAGLVRIPEVVR